MKKNLLFLLLLSCATTRLMAQTDMLKPVVRLEVEKDGLGTEIGAGIIVGQKGNELFVATAYHVVKEGTDTKVLLYQQTAALNGVLLHQDEALDIAVLKVPLPSGWLPPHLMPADTGLVKPQQKIVSIGHPGGSFWKPNYLNIVQEVSIYQNDRLMSITPQAVAGGCSGGPVFTLEGIWLAMVTETSMVEAQAVKAAVLVSMLKKWNIPTGLTIPEEPPLVKMPEGNYQGQYAVERVNRFSIGKSEVPYSNFQLFVAATGYVTDAEKQGFSWILYHRAEGDALTQSTLEALDRVFNQLKKAIDLKTFRFDRNLLYTYMIHDYKVGYKYISLVDWHCDASGGRRLDSEANHPVIHVSYNDAMAYCAWLSRLHGKTYRLPTVDEWNYAATLKGKILRYPKSTVVNYANLRDRSFCDTYGWDDGGAENDQFPMTAPVNVFKPNELGLFELAGNVKEWCTGSDTPTIKGLSFESRWFLSGEPEKDGWDVIKEYQPANAAFRSATVGFRVVREE